MTELSTSERQIGHMAEPSNSGRFGRNGGIQLSRIVDSLDNTIPLPQDLRAFLVYCAVLGAVASGMLIHVFLSAQILQTEVELADMQEHHTVVERQNGELLWRIGRATNFEHVKEKARKEGFLPIAERQFVEVDLSGAQVRPLSVSQPELDAALEALQTPPADAAPSADGSGEGDPATVDEAPGLGTEGGSDPSEAASNGAFRAPVDRMQTLRQWRQTLFDRQPAGAQPATNGELDEPGFLQGSALSEPESVEGETVGAESVVGEGFRVTQPEWFSDVLENVETLVAPPAGQ